MGGNSQLTQTGYAATFFQQQRGFVWLVLATDRAIDRTSSIFMYSPQEVTCISNCSAFITGLWVCWKTILLFVAAMNFSLLCPWRLMSVRKICWGNWGMWLSSGDGPHGYSALRHACGKVWCVEDGNWSRMVPEHQKGTEEPLRTVGQVQQRRLNQSQLEEVWTVIRMVPLVHLLLLENGYSANVYLVLPVILKDPIHHTALLVFSLPFQQDICYTYMYCKSLGGSRLVTSVPQSAWDLGFKSVWKSYLKPTVFALLNSCLSKWACTDVSKERVRICY